MPRAALDTSSNFTPGLMQEGRSGTVSSEESSMILPTFLFPYNDDEDDRRLMVYVTLLSGTTPNDLDLTVSECGEKIILKQRWPDVLMNPERLLSRYVNNDGRKEYNSKHVAVVAFRKAIREKRESASNQAITSTFHIELPFCCKNQLVSPPCDNRLAFELLSFESNLLLCAHLREVRTSYNKIEMKENVFVNLEDGDVATRAVKRKISKW